ncbi:MAG: ribonuclease HI [Alphaproteobacteria bacterium]|nr:ribonuclease HI [Alphaproteobacteria bacterium]MBR1480241.1 ribonuclease HI [Alphaproteobacteria bacterium]
MQGNFGVEDLEFSEFLKNLRDGDKVEIYTDGSCIGNPGPGGWAGVFVFRDKRTNISGFENNTTNNRMELMAAIESVRHTPEEIFATIYTDSTYVRNGITSWIKTWQQNNWRSVSGKAVKNQDLWMSLAEEVKGKHIEWVWVKGHSDCTNNNNADFVARSAIVASRMGNA